MTNYLHHGRILPFEILGVSVFDHTQLEHHSRVGTVPLIHVDSVLYHHIHFLEYAWSDHILLRDIHSPSEHNIRVVALEVGIQTHIHSVEALLAVVVDTMVDDVEEW
jgi:hypothetical protein